ncbi:MAG: hypothetical protein JW395_0454 [Nitrospira sp.]|nr:hypothetical protein [Nitrospira sp.]
MLEVRVDDRRRMYWREVVPPYVVRYLLPRLFCRIVRRATVIRELSASLTDFSEGNARATSGVSKTRFVPRRYSFKYFPRTPMPNEDREYSARSSSALPFDINHLFASGHHTCTDDPCFGTSNSMCDHNLAPVFLFPPKLARRDLTGGAHLGATHLSFRLLFKGGPIGLQLRASNEGFPRPRVARAKETNGLPFPSYTGRGARTDGLVSDRTRSFLSPLLSLLAGVQL